MNFELTDAGIERLLADMLKDAQEAGNAPAQRAICDLIIKVRINKKDKKRN